MHPSDWNALRDGNLRAHRKLPPGTRDYELTVNLQQPLNRQQAQHVELDLARGANLRIAARGYEIAVIVPRPVRLPVLLS